VAVAQPSAPVVREELWTSFASLLRSYVAAHGLQHLGEDTAHVEIGGSDILIRRGQKVMELRLDFATGAGIWKLNGKPDGRFKLLEEGVIQLEDESVEQMDLAAERLARALYAMK
jgi:hypothetical protein